MSNTHEQTCRKKQLELAEVIHNLCATLENEENERREVERRPERQDSRKPNSPYSVPNSCVLQCTPCRKLQEENDTGSENETRGERRNAIPNLCTTRGGLRTNHLYVDRWVRPDPSKVPLITYPEYANQRQAEKNDSNKPSHKEQQILGGVVYANCFCSKRNGLQDDCPLTMCRGRLGCKALPEPCCPNAYEEKLLVARRACEEGRYGSPTALYCPDI